METIVINGYDVVRRSDASDIGKEVKILLNKIAKALISDPSEEKAMREAMEAENLSWYVREDKD